MHAADRLRGQLMLVVGLQMKSRSVIALLVLLSSNSAVCCESSTAAPEGQRKIEAFQGRLSLWVESSWLVEKDPESGDPILHISGPQLQLLSILGFNDGEEITLENYSARYLERFRDIVKSSKQVSKCINGVKASGVHILQEGYDGERMAKQIFVSRINGYKFIFVLSAPEDEKNQWRSLHLVLGSVAIER